MENETTTAVAEPETQTEPEAPGSTAVEKRPAFEPMEFKPTGDAMVDFYNGFRARWAVAKVLAKSGIFRHKTPEAIMALMLVAEEMKMHYVTALRTMHVVEGGVGMSADLMLAKMYTAGVRWEVKTDTPETVEIEFTRGEMRYTSRFDDADVKRAQLDKPTSSGKPSNHVKYPRDMKRARAISRGARVIAPDVLANVYTPEELESIEAVVEPAAEIAAAETATGKIEALLMGAADALGDEE